MSQHSKIMKCEMCLLPGTQVGSFPLRRPECCPPIYVCNRGHNISEILDAFRTRCKSCPEHSRARLPEVEYIDAGGDGLNTTEWSDDDDDASLIGTK